MTGNEMIEEVRRIIGPEHKNDWKIAPLDHAKQYSETAPALSAILNDERINLVARRYTEDDKNARDAQAGFMNAAKRANQSVLAIACLGAILLVAGVFFTGQTAAADQTAGLNQALIQRIVFIGLGVLSILLVIVAQRWLLMLRQGDLLKAWMTKRARAESQRIQYFKAVVAMEPPIASPKVSIDLLKLEYFRRYLINSQINYFTKRSRDHRQAAKTMLNGSTWAVALGTGMMALSGFLAPENSRFAALAALGIIATAVAAYITNREAINQDQRNAERYFNTTRLLEDELIPNLKEARKLAAAGNTDAVMAVLDSASEILTDEHRQWMADIDRRNMAIARLEKTLKDLESKQTVQPTAAVSAKPSSEVLEDEEEPEATPESLDSNEYEEEEV